MFGQGLRVVCLSVALAVAGISCGKQPPKEPTWPIESPTEARAIAQREARMAGYDISRYRVLSAALTDDEPWQGRWRVDFEHEAPVPPGGRFTVYMAPNERKVDIMPGR